MSSELLCENPHLVRHRSEHTCPSAIYYQVQLVTNALYYKAKYVISLKLNPTISGTGDLILLSILPKPWTKVCVLGNNPFLLQYCTNKVITRTDFCECLISEGPYYLAQTMLACQGKHQQWMACLLCIMCLTTFFLTIWRYIITQREIAQTNNTDLRYSNLQFTSLMSSNGISTALIILLW